MGKVRKIYTSEATKQKRSSSLFSNPLEFEEVKFRGVYSFT